MNSCEIIIIGAGPAGIAAARSAAEAGVPTILIDDNPAPGGQIWRGAPKLAVPESVKVLSQTRVFDIRDRFLVLTDRFGAIETRKLILCTGARELLLPFPGWTLPGCFGAGGLQALVKSGMAIKGKRVVVAGSGPLLPAVAATLRSRGAKIVSVVEQAPFARIRQFLLRHRGRIPQALALRARLLGVRYRTAVWPVRFEAGSVTLSNGKSLKTDYLACGFGLIPNTELAQLLGCRLDDGFVAINSQQSTSVEGVYCAGEPTGIGGLDKAMEEGTVAGLAAAGRTVRRGIGRTGAFVRDLAKAFELDLRIADAATPDTLACRCEDVTCGALAGFRDWREAKILSRCGMGPCQGRICGPAMRYRFGWEPGSIRPPVVPVAAELLLQSSKTANTGK